MLAIVCVNTIFIISLLQQVREMSQPPLVNTTSQPGAGEGSNTEQDLDTIMDAVCKVVSYYELVSSVDSGSDLHAILTANVEDSCNLVGIIALMFCLKNRYLSS